MSTYPECDKMVKVNEQSQTIGEFIDWLGQDRGMYLVARCTVKECSKTACVEGYVPPINDLLAKFFDIDLSKVEEEKKAMLSEIRQANLEREEFGGS